MESRNFSRYNPFNLFIADYENAYCISYNGLKLSIAELPYGFSIIDNKEINSRDSKKKEMYQKILKKTKLPNPEYSYYESWKALLFSKEKNNNMENTAVYTYHKDKEYGTVSSSIICLPNKSIFKGKPIWLYNDLEIIKKKVVFTKIRMRNI